jgi:hypothetical protein
VRRTSPALLLWLLVPGLLLVPVLTPASAAPAPVAAAPAPVPVRPGVVELAVRGVDPAAAAEPSGVLPAVRLAGTTRRTVLLTGRRPTGRFGLLGVTWDRSPATGTVEAWARTRSGGTWSGWSLLGGAADEEADGAEAARSRGGTTPAWVGSADGVQVRVDLLRGAAPTGLRVALVDPGRSAADAAASAPFTTAATTTAARTVDPGIRPRSAWGADESIRTGAPAYARAVKAVVVHHTASANDYTAAEVPAVLRGIYAYHVKSRGWSDIGYNVLVDRFGNAWEGRAGGLSRAVVGAHAGGFNTGTVGVSMIGTYETTTPSAPLLERLAQVVAWRTAAAGVDPRGSVLLTSAGSTRFAAGLTVRLPTVHGHREVSTTACPGARGVAALPALRERAAALSRGAPPATRELQLVAPRSAAARRGAEVQVRGGAPGTAVELFVSRRGQEGAVRHRQGVLSETGTWTTTVVVDDDLTVFAVVGGRATARATVLRAPARVAAARRVAPAVTLSGPVHALPGSAVLLTAKGPPGAALSLWLRRSGQEGFVRRFEGRFDRAGRFHTRYRADAAYSWFARTATAASAEGATALGPVPDGLHATAPASAPAGQLVPLAVQGTPGAPVAVWFAREGEPAFSRRRDGVLGPDGMFRTSYVATAAHSFFATSGNRSSTRRTTRTTTAPALPSPAAPPLRLSAPASVPAGSAVPVLVQGRPRAAVELWTRRRGARTWTRSRTGTFGPDGRFATSYHGNDDHDLWATSGTASSRDVPTLTDPVVSGPPAVALGTRVRLTGRARPGDQVVLESRRRSTGAVRRTSVRADGSGAFSTSFVADDEYEHRPVAGGRPGPARRTAVAPTVGAPVRARRGADVTVTGTARPGARVEVLFRRDEGPRPGLAGRAPRPVQVFEVGRTVTADASGRWTTSWVLSWRASWFARADGQASPVRVTSPG